MRKDAILLCHDLGTTWQITCTLEFDAKQDGAAVSDQRKSRIQEFGYRTPRFQADFQFLLQINDPTPRLVDARCIDISSDGLGATMAERLHRGTQVTLMLALPGHSNTLRIAARVSHQQGCEHGFAFIFASQSERESIQKYLTSLRTRTVALGRPAR